jgi:hypothetical protein
MNIYLWDQNHIRMNITQTNWIDDLKTSIKSKQNWAKFSLRVDQNWGEGGYHSFPKIQALINLRRYKVAPSLGGPTLEAHIHTYLH